jgi:hypothetical protein
MAKKLFFITLSITLLFISSRYTPMEPSSTTVDSKDQALSQPRWDEKLNFQDVENRLMEEKVVSITQIAQYLAQTGKKYDFDNDVKLVILASGLKAVFKTGEDRYAEVAAYRANQFLAQRLVPLTILRTINGAQGSLQFFVESDIDLLEEKRAKKMFDQVSPKDLSDMKLFYFVFGQWDINTSNQIIQINNGKAYLALIDNAGINNQQQVQYGDFAFVCLAYSDKRNDSFDIQFPFDNPQVLHNPTLAKVQEIFREFVSQECVEGIWRRYKHISYGIWRNRIRLQFYKYNTSVTPNYTDTYFKSTLDAYGKLDKASLKQIWAEGLKEDKQHFSNLIKLILERRDQVLRATTL